MVLSLGFKKLQRLAYEEGLETMGFTGLAPLDSARERLISWQKKGYAADLEYMKRDPELFASPGRFLPGAGSIASFAIRYSSAPSEPLQNGHARIARYAFGRDYHRVLKRYLKRLIARVKEEAGEELQARIFSDAVPLLEREVARKSGLGFQGKNTMLIKPGIGSFFFLAEIIWNLSIVEDTLLPVLQDCGSCTRCLTDCPTGALNAPYQLDAGKCISYLTIEKRGWLSSAERRMLGEWIFGCDICQEVCPFNHSSQRKNIPPDLPEFVSRYTPAGQLDLNMILAIKDDNQFLKIFAGTPFMRAKRSGLIRNAAAVASNTEAEAAIDLLTERFIYDSDELIRLSCGTALLDLYHTFSRSRALTAVKEKLKSAGGNAESVLAEWESGGELRVDLR